MSFKDRLNDLDKKFEADLDALHKEYQERIKKLLKVDEAKPKVKPVFPNKDNCDDIWIVDGGEALPANGAQKDVVEGVPRMGVYGFDFVLSLSFVGGTHYSESDAKKELARMKARAYVIERINEANGGDNGFKVDGENFCVVSERGRLCSDQWVGIQFIEPIFYFRTNKGCVDALKEPGFMNAYKTMLGL